MVTSETIAGSQTRRADQLVESVQVGRAKVRSPPHACLQSVNST
jgi:hypothetical protein